jgi:hypothetical protein
MNVLRLMRGNLPSRRKSGIFEGLCHSQVAFGLALPAMQARLVGALRGGIVRLEA